MSVKIRSMQTGTASSYKGSTHWAFIWRGQGILNGLLRGSSPESWVDWLAGPESWACFLLA